MFATISLNPRSVPAGFSWKDACPDAVVATAGFSSPPERAVDLLTVQTIAMRTLYVLYFMPTDGDVRDFTQARVERAIVESDYLTNRVGRTSASRRAPDRYGLKRVGQGYVYFRGSDSDRRVSAVDADTVLLDEFDLMAEGVLDLALQQLASSELGWMRIASTPRFPEAGVNALFLQSDQQVYRLPCPRCGTEQVLTWDANVDVERALLVCRRTACRAPMNVWAEGRWVARAPGNTAIRGYHLPRLYSPFLNLERVILE